MELAGDIIFCTPRLTIRQFATNDWRRLQEFGGRPEVARMMASLKSPWPEEDIKAWLKPRSYQGQIGFGAAIDLSGAGLIGFLGIGGDPVNCAYAIDPEYWGNGYATEALRGLLGHCFGQLGLQTVQADHFTDNPASGRVLRKLGFVETGTDMGKSAARLELAPNITYRLTEPQFKAANQ